MSSRGRKNQTLPIQSNTLRGYFTSSEVQSDEMCRHIIEDLLTSVIVDPNELASEILDDLLTRILKPKKHSSDAVSTKTVAEWKLKYSWLDVTVTGSATDRMKCKICTNMQQQLKLTNVWATEGSPNFQLSGIVRHGQSAEHKFAYAAYEKQKIKSMATHSSIDTELDSDTPVSFDNSDILVFNTVYMAAKSEIPTNTINQLLELQTKNGLNMKYTNLSWDTLKDMQTSIAHVLQLELVNDIKASDVFALMLDESTDVTVDKRLGVCVRFVKGGEAQTKMLCNVHLDDGCAHTIVNCIAEQFEKCGIDLANCTSLATDGAAVMLGKKTGVGKQLISKYAPYCVQTHCMAHRLNLACTDSIKKNEFMLKFQEKFNSLYLFISASSNRTQALKNIQKILEEPEVTDKEPYSIRWLGLRNAVKAVYECFASVLVTLSKFAGEKNAVAKGLSKYFSSYKVALVVAFVLDIHNELAVLSCSLQKNNILFSEIKPLIDGTISKLTYFETNDGECLAEMRLALKKNDDGVEYEGEMQIWIVSLAMLEQTISRG